MKKKRTLRLLIIVICLYLAFTTVQGSVGLMSSGEKVTRREKVLVELENKQNDLVRREKQLSKLEYLEKVAYDELGLSRPGERVFIIPKELLTDNTPKVILDNTPNWKKWLDLLM